MGKEVSVFGKFGVCTLFGMDAKESEASVIVRGGECGWRHTYSILGAKGEGEGQGCYGQGSGFGWVSVGDGGSTLWTRPLWQEGREVWE